MESAATGPFRGTGAGVAALTAPDSLGSCRSGGTATSYRNPNFLPHYADGPPSGFPSQASFGALKLFADAAFELQSQKGGACPLPQELLQLVDPPEPCLICLAALHAKNKTIITVSDGTCWCRVASTQLPPVSSAPDGRPECPPDEEQLNVAAADLAGCLLRLSQLSITRTPRGKHIILCRAFHILSRDCRTVAHELQAQQRPEVIFPHWPEGTVTTPSLQQPQQSAQQQRPAGPLQPSSAQEASQQRPQVPHLAHQPQVVLGFQSQQQPQGEAASHASQREGCSSNHNAAGIYPQHMAQQHHLQQQQQLSHEKRPLSGQQQRERPFSDQHEVPQQLHQAVHPGQVQRRQQQLEQRRCQPEQPPQEHLLRGEGSVPATGLQRQHSPQHYGSWQRETTQQHRGVRDERPHQPEQHPPQVCRSIEGHHSAPNHKQEQPQQVRQQQMHEAPRQGPLSHIEGTAVPCSGPQRQSGVLSTYRSFPYQPSRPQAVQQQRAQHGVRASVGGESFIPIEDLTAYVAKWTIRARVDVKGDIRKYNNARGPGQLFNVELKDKSGEIRATFFNAAVDRWYNVLQEGKVYYFRGGAVKAKNPRYNTTRHNYEITFDEKSSILETQDEGDIPTLSSGMVDIKKIDAMEEVNAAVSIAAIVHDYRPMQSITIKATGQLKPKRDVFLVDENGLSICLTLWGEKAKEMSEEQLSQRPLVLFKRGMSKQTPEKRKSLVFCGNVCVLADVKVGDWNGKKLDSQSSTRIELFPTNDRTAALQEWWTREGCAHSAFQMVSSGSGAPVGRKEILKTLEQIGREAVQVDPSVIAEKGVYFSCAALLERVSDERFSWPACPDCRKKMAETVAHVWSCANCGRHFEQPNHTYMLNIMLMDASGSLRCTCMGDKAEEIMGSVKAETLLLLQDHQSLDEQGRSFNDVFADVNLEEWIFRICSKSDTYMDEMRLKHRVVAAVPLFRRVGDQTRHRLRFIRNTFAQFDIPYT